MPATRTRRLLTAAAAVALVASAPGFVSVASAHNNDGNGGRGSVISELASNAPLLDAVKAARADYRTAAKEAKDAYRAATAGAREAIVTATQTERDAFKKARADYRAARLAGTDTSEVAGGRRASATHAVSMSPSAANSATIRCRVILLYRPDRETARGMR